MSVFLKLREGDTVYYLGRQYFILGMFSQSIAIEEGLITTEWFTILSPIEPASPLSIGMHFYAPAIKVIPSILNNQDHGSEWSYLFRDDTS